MLKKIMLLCSINLCTAADILLVVGNSNNTVPQGSLSIGDAFVVDYLESQLGHQVQAIDDSEPQSIILSAAASSDLVIVVESVTSSYLGSKLKSTPKQVLTYEAFIQDEMGMTAPDPGGDPGPPTQYAYGVLENLTQINIIENTHPLAAGLTGVIDVYQQPKSITWGIVASSAEVIATLTDYPQGAVIYVYQPGNTLFDGTIAAGLRVGFFLEDDNDTGTPNLMTAQGLQLFEAAVAFSLGGGPTYLAGEGKIRPKSSKFSWYSRQTPLVFFEGELLNIRGRKIKRSGWQFRPELLD